MFETIDSVVSSASSFLWGYVLLFVLMGTHLYLTVILRFPQRYLFLALKRYFSKNGKDGEGHISPFSSLMVSLAAHVGTGNIIGVATALLAGGPGAIFWCWIMGILGMATRYAESLISHYYRVKDSKGQIVGGPMYAMERGLKMKRLGQVFAIFTAIAAFGIGNITQGNAVAQVLQNSQLQIPTWATGLTLTILVAVTLIGGIKSIARLCSSFVPVMSLIYIAGCILLLVAHMDAVWPALCLIVKSAFLPQAAMGGFIGSSIMIAMQTGVQRGLFSNEAGMGSTPIVSAPARANNSVDQALVSSTGPFWDTVVICTLTGLALTATQLKFPEIGSMSNTAITFEAFGTIGAIGSVLLTVSLASFVISTLLGWSYYGERSLQYLGGQKLITPYRILWVIVVFVGCVIPKSSFVWNFADLTNGLMALPNVICMIALSSLLISQTRHYLWNKKLDELDTRPLPVLEKK